VSFLNCKEFRQRMFFCNSLAIAFKRIKLGKLCGQAGARNATPACIFYWSIPALGASA
jgi:hypothetical protein